MQQGISGTSGTGRHIQMSMAFHLKGNQAAVPYIKYIAALLLFGSNGIVASRIHLESSQIILLRTMLGSLLLAAVAAAGKRACSGIMSRRDFMYVALSGVSMGVSWMFQYEAYQLVGILHVAALHVTGINRPAHPLLVPPDFIHPVVMTAAGTIGSLVEIAMQQYGGSTLLSACRTAIDSHIISIHIRILLGCSLDPEFTVRESGILQILVANLLKLLAAIGSSHRIELDYDETEFGKRSGVPVVWHETLSVLLRK